MKYTYKSLTIVEVGEMLRANGWEPFQGLVFSDAGDLKWTPLDLTGVCTSENSHFPFLTNDHRYSQAAIAIACDYDARDLMAICGILPNAIRQANGAQPLESD